MKSLHRNLLSAGLMACIGFGAIAQSPPAPQPSHGGAQATHAQRGGPDGTRAERHRARGQERMAKRFEVLKAQLKITTAQEGAWTTWTSALKPAARSAQQRPDRAEFMRLSTPERIDRMKAQRATRNAEMDRRLDATKSFYATLGSEQKAVFDALGLQHFGKGKGKGPMRGHGGHHGHFAR